MIKADTHCIAMCCRRIRDGSNQASDHKKDFFAAV